MAIKFLGTAINWGVAGVAMSGSGLGTFLMQGFDYEPTADKDQTRDEGGALVQETYYNDGAKAQFEYIVKGTGQADAITQSTVPILGIIINVTACPQNTALVATNWRVTESPSMKHSNTGKLMVTLKLEKHAGITAITGA